MKAQIEKYFSGFSSGGGAAEQGSLPATRKPTIVSTGDSLALHRAGDMRRAAFEERSGGVETLLVEPNGLFREGLKRILAETAYRPAMSGASFDEVQPLLEAGNGTPLLIVDAVQDFVATCEQVRTFKERRPSIRVVMLVDQYDLEQMLAAIEAGVAAYLVKSTSHEALVKTLDLVMLGETIFPVTVFTQLRETATAPNPGNARGLTERETAILECLTEGASNKVIARKLDIAEATVKVHVKTILRKLQAKNRTQAAMWASTHLMTRKS